VPYGALTECEAVIERGLRTFVEVGEALLRIRDERLYRETHGTFEDYCRERWGFTDRRARHLMGAAEVVADLPTGTVVPNEAVARELAPLRDEPEQLREAWSEAVEQHGPAPTAAQVREVIRGTGAPAPALPAGRCRVPPDLQAALRREFRFTGKAESREGTVRVGSQFEAAVQWVNPPARAASQWARAAQDFASMPGCVAVCILPVDTAAKWWWTCCRHGEVRFLREPLVWTEHGEERSLAAAIVIFGRRACVQWWEIPSVDSTAPPFAATEGGEDHDGTDDESARREPIEAPSASDAELARLRAKFPELGS